MNAIIDELTYISYAHNREIAPHISPERWRKLYGQRTEAMEARYQKSRGGR